MDTERREKIEKVLKSLMASEEGLALMQETVFQTGYKMMPRVEFMSLPKVDPDRLKSARTGVILDTETTGFDPKSDKIVQLSMLRFQYDEKGILAIGEIFDELNDPGFPIPPETTEIHKITNDMVAGKKITTEMIASFMEGVDMVIAHNAGFDRKFVEKSFPDAGFDKIDWHCSIEQINWKSRGFGKVNLEMLSLNSGFVYDAHNARSDILATAFVLARPDPETGTTPFSEMLEETSYPARHIFAVKSPFEKKDDLKNNGYRWADDDNPVQGFSKVWHKTIQGDPEVLAKEAEFLKTIYGRDMAIPMRVHTQRTRYSDRHGDSSLNFCTSENISFWEQIRMTRQEDPDPILMTGNTLSM